MIEKTILSYLSQKLDVPVGLVNIGHIPAECVLFEKTGGSKRNHIKSSTFAFQSYGDTLYKACELNEKLKTAVEDMAELDEIGSIRLNSDYNFTDTETKHYRYQAVFDITHY
ncbi:MAG: hypothetical protein MR269_05545 [Clostridiales bacterium]|nr:hypothetical protein [Clostridiales bacterium]